MINEKQKRKNNRILITGADGFIGRQLFAKIKALDPIGTKFSFKDVLQNENMHEIDLRCQSVVKEFIGKYDPEIVIHLAALISPELNEENPELARESHIQITSNIINSVGKDTQLIFLSTDKVFDGSNPYPDEDAETNPRYLYGRLKLDCENMIRERFEKYHILRLPIVHSLGDPTSVSFIDKALINLKTGKSVNAFNNVSRCYVRVNALIDLLAHIIKDKHYGVYNVGTIMTDYFSRIKQLCEEQKIELDGKLVPKIGKVFPMSQNLNTEKIRKVFNLSLN